MFGKQFGNVHFAYCIRSFWWLLLSIPESRAHANELRSVCEKSPRVLPDREVLPNLGDRLLADVGNSAMKELTEKMLDAGLSTQSIVNYTKVAKSFSSHTRTVGEKFRP
jgi:hypothetical protein